MKENTTIYSGKPVTAESFKVIKKFINAINRTDAATALGISTSTTYKVSKCDTFEDYQDYNKQHGEIYYNKQLNDTDDYYTVVLKRVADLEKKVKKLEDDKKTEGLRRYFGARS